MFGLPLPLPRRHLVAGGLLALVVIVLPGCGEAPPEPPDTYPVTGRVLLNGKPLTGGMIQLTNVQPSPLSTSGEVADDGTFSLFSIFGSQRLEGAVPGTYKVFVQARARGLEAITSHESTTTYEVEAGPTELTIELE